MYLFKCNIEMFLVWLRICHFSLAVVVMLAAGSPVLAADFTSAIDTTPPVTTPSVGGGIYTTPQTVTLSCSDGTGSGCSTTYYCFGKGCYPDIEYTRPIDINSSTYLSYSSSDSGYNYETVKTQRFTILETSPRTINVPVDRSTIQMAIDAASDGDTILVAPGTYVENIDFKGKVLSVTSSGGPGVTIIDGNGVGPVVSFISGEWLTSILDGFSIRNGSSEHGGGVLIIDSSPLIRNNRITNNIGCAGVGISLTNGSSLIQGNLIANNTQLSCNSEDGGGGIYLFWTFGAQLIDNTITENSVQSGNGGGIFLTVSEKTLIRGNNIRNNMASGYGGGIAMIYTDKSEIIQNVIADNRADSGGGIYWSIPFSEQSITLANNTIVANDAEQGSTVFAGGNDGNAVLINNIIAAKAGQTAMYCEDNNESLPPQLRSNVVFASGGIAYSGICTDQNGINGNITGDPWLSSSASGYYGLRPGSPAIDTGDSSIPLLPSIDLNGAPRIVDGSSQGLARIDIGAYEYDPDEPRAVLIDPPTGAIKELPISLSVTGSGIISYRYAIDGGPFTTVDTPIYSPIVLTSLASGTHAVAVIGKSLSREQRVSSATVAEWTVDSTPPVTTATPASGTYTEPKTVTLICSDNSGSGCTETFYCLGSDCTPTTPYTGPFTVSASTGLRYFSRDAFGYQEASKTESYNFVGTISGRVTDSTTGNGIRGVSVVAYSAATGSLLGYGGYTDGSGNYQISGLTSGNYTLRSYKYDYIEQWYSGKSDRGTANTVAVSAPGATTGINLAMVKGSSITGTVTDKDSGAGILGVHVEAYNAVTGTWSNSGYTDSSGAYSISGLVAGNYKVRFRNESYSDNLDQWYSDKIDLSSATVITVTTASTTSGINAALPKGGSITGTVTDSVGVAVSGVYVTAVDATTGVWGRSGYTDSSGVYRIAGLGGSYKLRAFCSGYVEQWYNGKSDEAAANTVTVTAPNTTAGINMAIIKGASITGVVTDSTTGAGIQGVSVSVLNPTTGSWVNSSYTNSSGAYSISGLVTGNYKLQFSANGYVEQWSGGKADQTMAAMVAVTAPNNTAIDMVLVKGAVITGKVTDSGTGNVIQMIRVYAYNVVTGSLAGYSYTDSSGVYSITGLSSGSYKLQFSGSSEAGYLTQWYSNKAQKNMANIVDVTAPNTVSGIDVTMDVGGVISGTVTDRETGALMPGVSVSAYDATTDSWTGYGYTDSSGNYSITGLPSGSYKLIFTNSGYVNQWFDGKADRTTATTVAVTVPNTTSGINVALVRGGSISGTVTDRSTGAGIAGSYLHVIDRSTGEWAGSAQTDGNGGYAITGLASGSYSLKVDSANDTGYLGGWYGGQDNYLCADTVAVTAPNATTGINVRLDMGGSISGWVIDAVTGLGIPWVNISLTSGSSQTVTTTTNTTADNSGYYVIGGLPSGEYSLTFNALDYVRTTNPIIAVVSAPNAVTGIDASLVRGGGISGRVTDNATGEGVGEVLVDALDTMSGAWGGSGMSDYNGNYTITGLPSGSYALYYSGMHAGAGYGSGWEFSQSSTSTTTGKVLASPVIGIPSAPVIDSVPTATSAYSAPATSSSQGFLPAQARSVSVVAPAITSGIDISIGRLGAIAGRVSDSASDLLLDWISVTAYDSITGAGLGSTITNGDGSYTISGVPSGSYRVQFKSAQSSDGGHQSKWYGSGSTSTVAAEVVVQAPETTSGIDSILDRGGAIAGSISVSSCPGPRQVLIKAYDASGKLVGQTSVYTSYADRFTIGALSAGSYKLAIVPGETGFIQQWYPGKTDSASAETVTVNAGEITSSINVLLAVGGGSISGKVSGNTGCTLVPVKLYDWYSGSLVAETSAASDGSFQLVGLPDASYKLLFTVNRLDLWYRIVGETAEASPIVVSGAAAVTGIDLTTSSAPDGDLDGSGGLPGLKDAIKALRVVVGIDAVTEDILAHGDLAPVVDGVSVPDGRLDISDVILILQKVVAIPVGQALN